MKWGYIRQTWKCGNSLEIEEKHTGRYGARGQKREKKRKATPEEMKQHNQWKRQRDLRRVIKWNFKKHDYWCTLTYPEKHRPSWEGIRKDLAKLIRNMRAIYRKYGVELKYVYRIGIGEKGGPHVHILINRFGNEETGTDIVIEECWNSIVSGHVNHKSIYEEGGYKKLAEYITKKLEEWEPEEMKRYGTSRNLIRKEPKEKIINRKELVDKNGKPIPPKAPKGYYVEKESWEKGTNPITGYHYRRYILVKINGRE